MPAGRETRYRGDGSIRAVGAVERGGADAVVAGDGSARSLAVRERQIAAQLDVVADKDITTGGYGQRTVDSRDAVRQDDVLEGHRGCADHKRLSASCVGRATVDATEQRQVSAATTCQNHTRCRVSNAHGRIRKPRGSAQQAALDTRGRVASATDVLDEVRDRGATRVRGSEERHYDMGD